MSLRWTAYVASEHPHCSAISKCARFRRRNKKRRTTGGTDGLKWLCNANCHFFYSLCVLRNAVCRKCRRCALASTTKLCTSCRSAGTPWRCCHSVPSLVDSLASRHTAAESQLWFHLTPPSLRSFLASSTNRTISSVRAVQFSSCSLYFLFLIHFIAVASP